jgi:hypothetical protein
MDLPMIKEDALYLLKFILNDNNLKDKEIEFMSGARINDIRTWKNTGYCFELKAKDSEALEKALKAIKKELQWTVNGEKRDFFAYQKTGETFVISVYPEADHDYGEGNDK